MIIALKKILSILCRKDSIFFNVHGAVLSFSFVPEIRHPRQSFRKELKDI